MALIRTTTCFLALTPDDGFAETVRGYKRRVERCAGSQLYLDDPPHVTLYLAEFADSAALARVAESVARTMRQPEARVRGWHVFHADPLNGNHTLVCDIDADGRRALASCQERVCAAAAPLRDREATHARYRAVWDRLAEAAQANVQAWGFPFVGSIWHPHVTVAAIRPADWDGVWRELENDAPVCPVRFPELCLYALDQSRPVLLERFDLRTEP